MKRLLELFEASFNERETRAYRIVGSVGTVLISVLARSRCHATATAVSILSSSPKAAVDCRASTTRSSPFSDTTRSGHMTNRIDLCILVQSFRCVSQLPVADQAMSFLRRFWTVPIADVAFLRLVPRFLGNPERPSSSRRLVDNCKRQSNACRLVDSYERPSSPPVTQKENPPGTKTGGILHSKVARAATTPAACTRRYQSSLRQSVDAYPSPGTMTRASGIAASLVGPETVGDRVSRSLAGMTMGW